MPTPTTALPTWTMPAPLWDFWHRQAVESWDLFVARGLPVNARDDDGWTPLRWALHSRNLPVMRALIAHGADVTTVAPREGSLLEQAFTERNDEAALLLLDAGAPLLTTEGPGPRLWLHEALTRAHPPLVQALLRDPAVDVQALDEQQRTVLHVLVTSPASSGQRAGLAAELVRRGAALDQQDHNGLTALLVAVRQGPSAAEILDVLIDAGANVSLLDLRGHGWDRTAAGVPIAPEKRALLEQRFLRQTLAVVLRDTPVVTSAPSRPRL